MIDVTEIRCLDSVDVDVDVTKLAWRFDETGAGLDSTAWRLDSDVTEIRSLDSVDQRAIMKKRRIRAKSPLQVNPNRKQRDGTGC